MSGLDDIGKRLFGASTLSDFASQVGDGFFGTDYQKDYSHASKLMRPDGMALAPKQKFLFHTFFTPTYPELIKGNDKGLVGALVKTVELPKFRLDTEEYIQYNRKRLVHNRINYEPVTITLHDDGRGHVLDLWKNYYQYYFDDSDYDYTEGGIVTAPGALGKVNYNGRDIYSPDLVNSTAGWGKSIAAKTETTPGVKPAFFKDIKIYGFNRGGFVLYTLINPVIISFEHDTYDYADGAGTMEHRMQVQYEAVKYYDSATAKDKSADEILVEGFGLESRYDTEPGALGPGSTTSTFGQGGLVDTGQSVIKDLSSGNPLSIIKAGRDIGRSARTFGSIDNLKDVVTGDAIQSVQSQVLETLNSPTRLINFPTRENNPINQARTITPKKANDDGTE